MSEIRYGLHAEQWLDFLLPDTDDLHIGGILRGDLSQPTVVMMHGLFDETVKWFEGIENDINR